MGKVGQVAVAIGKAERGATHAAAAQHKNPVVRVLGGASELADQPPLAVLGIATLLLGAVLRRPAVARSGARMLASHALAAGIKTVIKNAVDRTRPAEAMKKGHRVAKGTGTTRTELNSFPSGHTAGAVAVARAATRDLGAAALPSGLAAGAVAAIQMPRGKHYVSDVAAGAAIGWVSELAASALMRVVEQPLEKQWAAWRGSLQDNGSSDPAAPNGSEAGNRLADHDPNPHG